MIGTDRWDNRAWPVTNSVTFSEPVRTTLRDQYETAPHAED